MLPIRDASQRRMFNTAIALGIALYVFIATILIIRAASGPAYFDDASYGAQPAYEVLEP